MECALALNKSSASSPVTPLALTSNGAVHATIVHYFQNASCHDLSLRFTKLTERLYHSLVGKSPNTAEASTPHRTKSINHNLSEKQQSGA